MSAAESSEIYRELHKITYDYFGPATDRFLHAHIKHHLKKKPADLKRSDIPLLIEWLSLSLALMADDTKPINEYTERIRKLSE